MWQSAELHFAADHPTAAGHFPNDPVIPGALLLDSALAAIAGEAGNAVTLRAAKFLHPIRPGEHINLRWETPEHGAIRFECRLAGQDILAVTGTLELQP